MALDKNTRYMTVKLFVLIILFQLGYLVNLGQSSPRLAGVWKAVADQQTDSSGKVVKEDTTVRGLLIYTTVGKMGVQIQWPSVRQSIMHDSIMNGDGVSSGLGIGSNTWSDLQRGKIIDSYDAYFGDYSVDAANKIVTHTLTANLRPERPGVTFQRRYRLLGDTLYLRSADPAASWQMKFIRIKNQDPGFKKTAKKIND